MIPVDPNGLLATPWIREAKIGTVLCHDSTTLPGLYVKYDENHWLLIISEDVIEIAWEPFTETFTDEDMEDRLPLFLISEPT